MTVYRNILALLATFTFGAATLNAAGWNGYYAWLALGLTLYSARSIRLER